MNKHRLLIVTPDRSIRMEVAQALIGTGQFDLEYAQNSGAAIYCLNTGSAITAILTESEGDQTDGIELLKQIRTARTLAPSNMPFGVITRKIEADLINAAKRLDVTDVLVRPFTLATLIQRVRRLVNVRLRGRPYQIYEDVSIPVAGDRGMSSCVQLENSHVQRTTVSQ